LIAASRSRSFAYARMIVSMPRRPRVRRPLVSRRPRWAAFALLALWAAACDPQAAAPPQAPTQASLQDPSSLSAGFEPALVDPTVPAEDIHDDADILVTTDPEALIQFVDRGVGQDRVDEENRSLLRAPVPDGREVFTRFWFTSSPSVAFVLRTARDARALIMRRTERYTPVPWISWIADVLNVAGPNPDELKPWYQEIGRRLATADRATAIVLFPNGNAMAVIVGVVSAPGNDADVQLVALTRFMRAGSYAAGAWGPALSGATHVTTRKMNGHAGVSVRDFLRAGGPSAPPPAVAPVTSI
jgi:hypothetical protein